MKRLFYIFSVIVFSLHLSATNAVYTITSKTELNVENAPTGSEYEFEQTGSQKFRMTAGTSTILRLRGYADCQIQAVSLSMKSNQASGSGSLTMTIGDKEVWTINNQAFSDKGWYGEYSTEYVEITKMLFTEDTPQADNVEIIIQSTENSIYINRITIAYTGGNTNHNPTDPNDDDDNKNDDDNKSEFPFYFVTFETQIESEPDFYIAVQEGDSLVCPPFYYDNGYWSFCGWSYMLFDTIVTTPGPLQIAGDVISIDQDMTLYATYRHKPTITIPDTLTTDNYIATLASSSKDLIMYNRNDTLRYMDFDIKTFYYEKSYETHIEILSDSTMYIMYGNKYLYNNGSDRNVKISSSKFIWNYRCEEKHYHIFTYQIDGNMNYHPYYLALSTDYGLNYKPSLIDASAYNSSLHWTFYEIPSDINTRYFCSYPEGKPTAINQINDDDNITIDSNLILNHFSTNIQIYDISGKMLINSRSEYINLNALPQGLYILSYDNKYRKILKR